MIKGKRNHKEEGSKEKKIPFSFSMEDIKGNITHNTNKQSKPSKEQIINQAFKYHSQGNIVEAAKYYQYFINQGFKDYRVFSNYGDILRNLGELKEAEISTRKAIQLNPNFANAYSNLGNILRDLGILKEAETYTRKAIELNPNFANAYSNLGNILRDLGKLKEAEISTRKAIQLNPNYANAYTNLGNILRDLGKLKEAEISTRKAIQLNPNFANAYSNLGNILGDLGKLKEAEISTRKAIELNPNFANAYANLGVILIGLGKLKEAEISYRKVIELKPDFPDARFYSNYGVILKNLGKFQEAEISYRKAIELKPDFADAYSNLGNILRDLGKLKEAEISILKAIQLNPSFTNAYSNLGIILRDLGKLKEAETCTRKAIQLNSNFANAYSNLGNILRDLGKLKEAEISTRKAIQLNPNFANAYANLGNILRDFAKLKEAGTAYRKAIELKPDLIDAYYNLGITLEELGEREEAIKQYTFALDYKSDDIAYLINSKLTLSPIMNSNKQIDIERNEYKKQLNKIKNNKNSYYQGQRMFNTSMFYFAYHNKSDDKIILEELANTLSKIKGISNNNFDIDRQNYLNSKNEIIKIGICSEFFRETHTIGKLYTKVLIDLLKTDLEITIYVTPEVQKRGEQDIIRKSFTRVIELPLSTIEAQKIIFNDKLDVIFYPDIGMSTYTYILALSRLALVQVNSLGHPNTSGIKNIDYFITNDIVPHHPSSSYTERLIKFSRLPFNYPTPKIDESKLTSKNIINFDDKFMIGLTQTLFKLHPDFDQVLESILMKIKNSYLILIKDKYEHRTEELKKRWKKQSNLLLERSIFLNRMPQDDFINTTKNCHIMLDPFYFGAGNTFYEAMAFGIPFITYPFSQRGSLVASGYKQMRLKNPPIAKSPEDYISWCEKYANNNLFLKKTKDELKERANKYLFNDNKIYQEYYTFFTEAVKKARQGEFLEDNWKPFALSKNKSK